MLQIPVIMTMQALAGLFTKAVELTRRPGEEAASGRRVITRVLILLVLMAVVLMAVVLIARVLIGLIVVAGVLVPAVSIPGVLIPGVLRLMGRVIVRSRRIRRRG